MQSLQKAQEIILRGIKPLSDELVSLRDGLHRTVFSDIAASAPRPSFDESTRDGYVVALSAHQGEKFRRLKIVGEIPAGKPRGDGLSPGTACRIMTGGCVPLGGVRVIPYEQCVEKSGYLVVADDLLHAADICIRKRGSETAEGDILVQGGVNLRPMHLGLLASSGVHSVSVSRQPSLGFFCTGSELKSLACGIENGQKFSSNSFLLHGLAAEGGAFPVDFGLIEDDESALPALFTKIKKRGLDLLVSTGGMGPGKYDLVRDAFAEAGGQEILTALKMRPGKSMLFGILGKTLYFGLPGPPDAVHTLFTVLVSPVLLAMQGREKALPKTIQALLQHQIKVKHADVMRLRDGVLCLDGERSSVRFAGRFETPNCYILLQPEQTCYRNGDPVDVYLKPASVM